VLLNWRFMDLPSRSTVIDLPIEAKHVPNFFVEATLVRNGRLHTEARELFVPPVKGLLNVAIRTDKPVYQPGETGKVSVAVTDLSGEPVRGQVALTAYDRAVTYIQDEFGPSRGYSTTGKALPHALRQFLGRPDLRRLGQFRASRMVCEPGRRAGGLARVVGAGGIGTKPGHLWRHQWSRQ